MNYHINKDVAAAFAKYEREHDRSPSLIIENLLKKFLYKNGYLTVKKTISKTPEEIYGERKQKFKVSRGRLYYGELKFFMVNNVDSQELEGIIENLLKFSDEELQQIQYSKWIGSSNQYKQFVYAKFENPSLSMENFLEHIERKKYIHRRESGFQVRKDNRTYGIYDNFEDAVIVRDFLSEKQWDERYASKNSDLRGKKYNEWLLSEIKKEKQLKKEEIL